MANYIDGFVFPIATKYLAEYKSVAEKIAKVWNEYGALAYTECVGDNLNMEGTRSFKESINATADETIIFGWLVFESKEARNIAHKKVAEDPRMADLVAPLVNPEKMIFDAGRMCFGGFKSFV